jgi:probable phosphoglycerate mutase
MIRTGITVHFIRHGQTDWNAARRYQGQRDIPLNDTGRAQARRNGETLIGLRPEVAAADFISSPLGRARETMEIVRAAMRLEPSAYRIEDAIKEIHYGHWEGVLADDIPARDPDGLALRRRDPFRWRPEGGESYHDLAERTGRWLESLERDAVVTSHGGVGRTLQGLVLGLAPDEVLRLEAPQDRIMVIRRGDIDWL